MYVCMYVCMYVYVCIYIYIYIYDLLYEEYSFFGISYHMHQTPPKQKGTDKSPLSCIATPEAAAAHGPGVIVSMFSEPGVG